MGTSRHTGGYWTGTLQFFRDDAALINRCLCSVEAILDAGVTDLVLVGDNHTIVGQDNGNEW